ncbi:MAG: 4-alpha-glucanotransferase, partial [Candidatus Competibacter sp.]
NAVAYTGTHDNDTTMGWFQQLDEPTRAHLFDYLGGGSERMPELLVRTVFASVARLAVIPMQDLLELGSEDRMNRPGVPDGNWRWRFRWKQIAPHVADHYQHLMHLYGRI